MPATILASLTSPTGQTCVFAPLNINVGTMPAGDVASVDVTCGPQTYTLGGSVNGLLANSNVTLQNGNDTIAGRQRRLQLSYGSPLQHELRRYADLTVWGRRAPSWVPTQAPWAPPTFPTWASRAARKHSRWAARVSGLGRQRYGELAKWWRQRCRGQWAVHLSHGSQPSTATTARR